MTLAIVKVRRLVAIFASVDTRQNGSFILAVKLGHPM